jgi:hypothetical protein
MSFSTHEVVASDGTSATLTDFSLNESGSDSYSDGTQGSDATDSSSDSFNWSDNGQGKKRGGRKGGKKRCQIRMALPLSPLELTATYATTPVAYRTIRRHSVGS